MNREQVPKTIVPGSPFVAVRWFRVFAIQQLTEPHPFAQIKADSQVRGVTTERDQPGLGEMLTFVELDDEARTTHIVVARRHLRCADEVVVTSMAAQRVEDGL